MLELKQSDWMTNHIDFNTEKRMNAANGFEKDFFKLMKKRRKIDEKESL